MWARDKLLVVQTYLWRFSMACNGAKRRYTPYPWWYVDAMAGPGVNRFDDGTQCAGSPLIALQVDDPPTYPAAEGLVFAEADEDNASALEARCAPDARAQVVPVDINQATAAVLSHVPRRAPSLAFFDPEGFEVDWATLRAFATHKRAENKMELLVMLPLYVGMLRTLFLGREALPDWAEDSWDRVFTAVDWRGIRDRRIAGDLDATVAAEELVDAYRRAFVTDLGYRVAHRRVVPVVGRARYWLVFATDHEGGERIMDSVMSTVYHDPSRQQSLFAPDQSDFRRR